ncbi:MAG: hypothetical protein ACE15F_19815 [bacterium]
MKNQSAFPRLLGEILFFLSFLLMIVLSWKIAEAGAAPFIFFPAFFDAFATAGFLVFLFLLLFRLGSFSGNHPPNRMRRVMKECAMPGVLVGVSFYWFGGLFGDGFPSTIDHATRLLRCDLTERALWEHGTLLPWTSAIGAGVPLNDLYPPGGEILYCLIRLLSCFTLERETAYGLIVFTAWLVLLGSLYGAGRYYSGIAGGTLAALLLLLDPGSIALPGWAQGFSVGMWPVILSAGFLVLTVTLFGATLHHSAGRGRMLWLALLVMAAPLAHVMALLGLILALPVVTGVGFLHAENRSLYIRRTLRNGLFSLFGLGMAAWWVIPFFLSSGWTLPYGAPVISPAMRAARIVEGTLFENTPPLFAYLGLLGTGWGICSGQPMMTACSLLYWAFLLLNLDTLYTWFFSPALSGLIMNVPLYRFGGYSKLLGYILAGGMAQSLLAQAGPALERCGKRIYAFGRPAVENHPLVWIPGSLLACLLATLGVAMAVPLGRSLGTTFQRHYGGTERFPIATSATHPSFVHDFEQAMAKIQSLEPHHAAADAFFLPLSCPRIGIQTNVIESAIPFEYGFGIVPPRYMPATTFSTRAAWTDVSAPYLAGMKYFIAYGGLAQNLEAQPDWEAPRRFGEVTLLRNRRYLANPVFLLGETRGTATVEIQESGRLGIRLRGLESETWLRVGISRYRKWRARLNGQAVPIQEHIEPHEPLDVGRYISVPVQNGFLELTYQPESLDWAAYILSISSLICLMIILTWRGLFHYFSFTTIPPHRSRLAPIPPAGKRLTIVFVMLMMLGTAGYGLLFHDNATRFWYAGITTDALGRMKGEPDGELDLEFAVHFGEDVRGKTLDSITLHEIRRAGLPPTANAWSTRAGPLWKIRVAAWNETPPRWDRNGEPMNIPLSPPHSLRLFAANPYRGDYVAGGTEIELTLSFTDGSALTRRCALWPQGNH